MSAIMEKGETVAHVDADQSKILANQDLMADAFDGENHEHEQTVWQAVKAHPWACLWAFIMCFTIVSLSHKSLHGDEFPVSGFGKLGWPLMIPEQ
jgi:MFS transporter, SP family, general alpha glucoside:H+ symporter